jgi:glycosyltransferase involved in cell wall biosynthesis
VTPTTQTSRRPRVFLMDLLATVPYYTAYLSQALLRENSVDLTVGSIDYYLDPKCFSSRGIHLDPGLMNSVGRFHLPKLPRRLLKLTESMLNLAALTARFALSPPDVIHVQFLPMLRSRLPLDLWFIEMCQRRGAKIVLTVHDLLPHDTGEAHKTAYADLYRRVDALICHSDSIRNRLMAEFSVPEAKISVIPHGPFFYDLPASGDDQVLREFALPAEHLMVLWQGIIFPYKGIDLLLSAWKQVEAQNANAWLVIAGTGSPDLLEQIRDQVAALGLTRVALHFRFISSEELVALYRRADVVVYPYRAITTSGALATGLALGKTVVATDLPVFRELLKDGENARLVPGLDTPALADALTELLQDSALREKLASAVREMRFGDESWLTIAKQTAEVYRRVAG